MTDAPKLHANEAIKQNSNFLRGTIAEGLARTATGALAADDTQLTKFHGIYQQDDRDLRPERRRKRLEPAYSFMIRVRMPGGAITPAQWLALDSLARNRANGTIRLTTRQAIQFHGVIKSNLKAAVQEINAALLDTIAACGDVNRNVMCCANPHESAVHAEAMALAQAISDRLTPRTRAYHEIWIDGEKVHDGEETAVDAEPVYGATYLPRKFKTVVAVPPVNDVDVFAQDLGFIAIAEDGQLVGYNVTVGGGMGMTHGEAETFPRLADMIGFVSPEEAVEVAETVVRIQRDWGNRENRKRARLKYTIVDHGLDIFREELHRRLGWELEPPREVAFTRTGDRLGWIQGDDGLWHYTLLIENGRVADLPVHGFFIGLRRVAEVLEGEFRVTPNQNLVIARVPPAQKPEIERILLAHRLVREGDSGLRRNAMACVALPTCGLALAESERYLPDLVGELEIALAELGLDRDEIVIRMTGCPNGCARPYVAEIGLVGRNPQLYSLYLGAAFDGSRPNRLWRQDVPAAEIAGHLRPLLAAWRDGREAGEHFGDFLIRSGCIPAPTGAPAEFHMPLEQGAA